MEDKITLLTPQFLCETYFQRQQPWGHIIIAFHYGNNFEYLSLWSEVQFLKIQIQKIH